MRLLEIFNERLREECHPRGTLSTSKKPISLGVSDYIRSNKLEELEHLGRHWRPDGASIADNPSVRSTTKTPPNHLPKHPPISSTKATKGKDKKRKMQDSSEDASDSKDQKVTKRQKVSEEPFIRKELLDDEDWLVGAGSEAEDIGGEKKTKPNVVTNTVGLAAEKSDKQVDLQQNGEAGAVCQATSSQSIADGDVMQDGEDSASTHAAGSQEMVDRVGKQDGKFGDDAQDRQAGNLLPEILQQDGHGKTVLHEKVQSIGNEEDEMDGVGQHDEDLK